MIAGRLGALLLAMGVLAEAGSARADDTKGDAKALAADSTPASTTEQDEDYAQVVTVRGAGGASPRGVSDVRIKRELIDASPRQQTSEMLSAAPGFFVDHEDGEGLGNDVYLRGFDLDHGSGIEMRVGSIPINIPTHIQGQGYADASFIIPEVVRSIRVLQGPYDPRQGDAAIVGSAYFDLGVPERGFLLKSTYGSFGQARLAAVVAPKDMDEESFAAFSLRKTDGFGQDRAARSGAAIAQHAFDLGAHDRLRVILTAYGAESDLPGVVRRDDVDAGRIGFYDAYPENAGGQGVRSSRFIAGVDYDHVAPSGGHFEVAPFVMWTSYRARQNFTGNLESSQIDPSLAGLGDLFETTNRETAAGLTSRYHAAPVRLSDAFEIAAEPGIYARAGHTDQTKSLLTADDQRLWDRRIDASLDTLDLGAYLDVDLRVAKRLRISGGPRADLLALSIRDHLAGQTKDPSGVAFGPRVSAEYELWPSLVPIVSYGEGFRSLDADHLSDGAAPYSKVRSMEAGVRAEVPGGRYTATIAAFETRVANELVFEAEAGGLETENASVRRGVVGAIVAKPFDWLLASTSMSVTHAIFTTRVPGVSHFVPNVPSILYRTDVTARHALTRIGDTTLHGRVGVGYTLLGGRHLTDSLIAPPSNVLNANAAVRYGAVEVGVDAFNVLGLRYADEEEVYVSNWGFRPGQGPASVGRHIMAAPPRTVLASISLYF